MRPSPTALRLLGLLLALCVLALLALDVVPRAMMGRVHAQVEAAEALPGLAQRVAALEQSRALLRMIQASPPWQGDVERVEQDIDQRIRRAFEQQRRTLEAGQAGAELHLAWLDARIAAPRDPYQTSQDQLDRTRALVSYGEVDAGRVPPAREQQGPSAAQWANLAALLDGRREDLQPSRADAGASGLALLSSGRPAIPTAGGPAPEGAVARIVEAELARRTGDLGRARALLLPLLMSGEPGAALAAESWGQVLLDGLAAEPEGLSLVEVDAAGLVAADLAPLQAFLLTAPAEDPAFLGAWLALAEVGLRLGDPELQRAASWAAIEAALPIWAAAAGDIPALSRLDAPGAVHPDRVQRVRVELDAARISAEQALDPEAGALRRGVVALLLLQARAELSAGDLRGAQGLLDKARALLPGSPPVLAWSAWARVLSGDPEGALVLVAADGSPELGAVRAVVETWARPLAPTPVEAPARALRTRLREVWNPGEIEAFARVHAARAAELDLALRSPPEDRADPAQALAQASLRLRVNELLGQPEAIAEALARRDRLQRLALDQPLWGLFVEQAFTLEAGDPDPDAI